MDFTETQKEKTPQPTTPIIHYKLRQTSFYLRECGSQPKNGKSQRNFLCSPKMRLDRTARLLTNRPLIIAMLEIFTKGNYPLQKCNVGFQCEDERFKRITMSETILRSYAQNDLEIGMAEKIQSIRYMVFATSHANAALWQRQIFALHDPRHQKFMVTKPSFLSK